MVGIGRDLWRSSNLKPTQASLPGAACPGPCKTDIEKIQGWRLHNLNGNLCQFSVTLPVIFRWISCVSVCTHCPLPAQTLYSFHVPSRYSYSMTRPPWAFFSLSETVSTLSAFSHSRDAPVLYSLLWPFNGFPPVCSSLSLSGEHRIGHNNLGMASPGLSSHLPWLADSLTLPRIA